VRSKPGAHVVIINPGQPDFDEGYMELADVAMSYENPYGSTSDGYAPGEYSAPAWMNKYPAERFWHVILEVSDAAAMANVVALARSRNVGHVYVSNYADPPAYARLPTYFAEEVSELSR
ncbi:MAG TPA: spherulation-specific family 4 protein, partial [Polyangiaceae bacterium]|nr:spherulation-specific family 4 protein [Polyangiaceae bacterium]